MVRHGSVFCLLVVLVGPVASYPREDEAHRLDRLQTKNLNDVALSRLTPIVPRSGEAPGTPPARMLTPAEQTLKDAEDRAVDAWRRRMAACRTGHHEAC